MYNIKPGSMALSISSCLLLLCTLGMWISKIIRTLEWGDRNQYYHVSSFTLTPQNPLQYPRFHADHLRNPMTQSNRRNRFAPGPATLTMKKLGKRKGHHHALPSIKPKKSR